MRVWLDDERPPPDDSWIHVRTPEDAVALLTAGDVTDLSLDHDLGLTGGGRERTGYDVLLWLEREVETRRLSVPERITIHSANVGARRRMELAIQSLLKLERR